MNPAIEKAPPYIRDLVPYEPGKPIDDVAREWGLDPASIIKLASNENPLGPSPKAKAAMLKAIEKAELYPDGGGYHLRTAIAEKFGLSIGNVILGNGSNEILEFLGKAFLQPGDDIIAARHAFAVYPLIAHMCGARTIEVPDPGFRHDLKAMVAAITPRTKLFFITTPNNPTGTICSEQEIFDCVAAIPPHIVVVIDEAYYEFLDHPPPHDRSDPQISQCHSNADFLEDSGSGRPAHWLRAGPSGTRRGFAKNAPAI
ncbi:aminotransferase class I/II-fold pyridoxal phosphate-dependent enzyme [Oscillatoria amoena NRMC-F 0135]|nr:aminotransferase class I/II-fold pyridoxal phosphate-dependent enzyme [Oscillatoria amoena NRMC-F 0135]